MIERISIRMLIRNAPVLLARLPNSDVRVAAHIEELIVASRATSGDRRQSAAIKQLRTAAQCYELLPRTQTSDERRNLSGQVFLEIGRLHLVRKEKDEAAQAFREAIGAADLTSPLYESALTQLMSLGAVDTTQLGNYTRYISREDSQFHGDELVLTVLQERTLVQAYEASTTRKSTIDLVTALRRRGAAMPWLLRLHARSLEEQGLLAEALTELQRLLDLQQATRDDQHKIGRLQTTLGRYDAARHTYIALTTQNNSDAEAYYCAGLLSLRIAESELGNRRSELDSAIRNLAKASALVPTDAEFHAALGMAYAGQSNFSKAKTELEFALAAGKDSIEIRTTLAHSLKGLGESERSRENSRHAAVLAMTDASLWQKAGEAALECGDHADAVRCFELAKLYAIAPLEITSQLARAHEALNHPYNVIELLASMTNPTQEDTLRLARARIAAGQPEEAIVVCQKILAHQPGNDDARYIYGYALMGIRRWSEASAELMRIREATLCPHAFSLAAFAHLRQGDADAAMRVCEMMQKRGMDLSLMHHVRAVVARLKGDIFTARAEWTRAVKIDPTYAPALYGKAELHEFEKQFESAAEIYLQLQDMYPHSRQYVERACLCLAHAGRYEQAITRLEQEASIRALGQTSLECMAYCYGRLQKWTEASDVIKRIPSTQLKSASVQKTTFIVSYELARAAHIGGNHDEARRILRQLAAAFPEKPFASHSLTQIDSIAASANLSQGTALTDVLVALSRLAEASPTSFQAQVLPALQDIAKNTTPRAKWSTYASLTPMSGIQHITLATIAFAKKEWDTLASITNTNRFSEEIESDNWQACYLRGIASLYTGNATDALEHLRKALTARNDLDASEFEALLHCTVSAALRTREIDAAIALLETSNSAETRRIRGILHVLSGRHADAAALLDNIKLGRKSADPAQTIVVRHTLQRLIEAEHYEEALKILERFPKDALSDTLRNCARLELLLRIAEASFRKQPDAESKLPNCIELLLLEQRYIRRAAMLATREALVAKETPARMRARYRLAAALWATTLLADRTWQALNEDRIRGGLLPIPNEKRETITRAAQNRLLDSIRARITEGWSTNDSDLTGAMVRYEFVCCKLFAQSGIGNSNLIPGWIEGLSPSPYLFVQNKGLLEDSPTLKSLCSAMLKVLSNSKSANSEDASRLYSYLDIHTGFAKFLLDDDKPQLALLWLNESRSRNSSISDVRARAHVQFGIQLSNDSDSAHHALEEFEKASKLGAEITDVHAEIIKAAVLAAEHQLRIAPNDPEEALALLQRAVDLCGSDDDLKVSMAKVHVHAGALLEQRNELTAAKQRYEQALRLDDTFETRGMLNSLVTRMQFSRY